MIINEPHVWPNSGTMIPLGSLISVSLECVSGHATQRVLELDQDKQPCLYDETSMYNQETCLSLCKRYWVAKYCGCNPSFFFPASMISCISGYDCDVNDTSLMFHVYVLATRYRDCTIEDFICLIDYNGEQIPVRKFNLHEIKHISREYVPNIINQNMNITCFCETLDGDARSVQRLHRSLWRGVPA